MFLKEILEIHFLSQHERWAEKQIVAHENIAINPACMTAKVIMDVSHGFAFHITIVKFVKVNLKLPKHHKVGEVTVAPFKAVHNINDHFSWPSDAHENNSESSVNDVHYKPIPHQ